jgi:hypothetical protein
VHAGANLLAVCFLAASAASACLLARLLPAPQKSMRWLVGLVFWQLLLILPVHLLAAAQLAGLIARVDLAGIFAFQIALLALALWLSRRNRSAPPQPTLSARPRWPTYLLLCAAALGVSYAVFAINSATSFPTGSDALIYHLPLATRWLQSGSLDLPASGAWRYSLPGNAEIMMMITLATGWQPAVMLVSCVSGAILLFSVYLLADWFAAGNAPAATAICLIVLSLPMVEFQAFSAYVDLMGTADILAGLALLLSARKFFAETRVSTQLRYWTLVISALACGISIGTKPVFYFYALLWMALLIAVVWDNLAICTRLCALLILLGLTAPSAFWFGRAAVRTSNPLYPLKVSIGGHVIFPGYDRRQITDVSHEENFVHRPSGWLAYPWTEWKRDPGYVLIPYSVDSGVGAAFASFVPLGLAFLAVGVFSGRSRDRLQIVLFMLLISGAMAWWLFMLRVPRFGLPLLVLACVLTTPLVQRFQASAARLFAALLFSSVCATAVISGFIPLHELAGRVRTRQSGRPRIYAYPAMLDALPPGSRVLNATGLEEKNFALAGSHLTNAVIADFEAPAELTAESLRVAGASYIAEIVPGSRYPAPSFELGAKLINIDDEVVASGETAGLHWRIWQVREAPTRESH